VLAGVRKELLSELLAEPLLERLRPEPDPFERAVVACTSAPFCKFGIFNVKEKGAELIEHLRLALSPSRGDSLHGLRIHIAGCKASCAQTHAGHIGLRATVAKDEIGHREAFDIALGGDPGGGRLARWVAAAVPLEEAFATIASLLEAAAEDARGPAALAELHPAPSSEEGL